MFLRRAGGMHVRSVLIGPGVGQRGAAQIGPSQSSITDSRELNMIQRVE